MPLNEQATKIPSPKLQRWNTPLKSLKLAGLVAFEHPRRLRPPCLRKPTEAAASRFPLPTNRGTFLLPRFRKLNEKTECEGQFLTLKLAFDMRLTVCPHDTRLAILLPRREQTKLAD